MFKVEPGMLIGRPENPPAFPVEHQFQVGGQTLEIADVVGAGRRPRASRPGGST